ncbi:DNA repair protein [Klebsormidium nitens]|uniref:DNA repair protein n=1 Tax=Klebsormidium nitens TaxID=105231 RepID=A0A1Y1I020_KLENI|nr:DNA repair protein [Klebsormidium nitens]|eukprot:GAQ82127.1 DNA repair protein [Klebsormidium nitens]
MGKKEKTIYVCSECGEDFLQWQGQCPACKQWNCLKRFKVENDASGAAGKKGGGGAGARAVAGIGSDMELRKPDVTSEEVRGVTRRGSWLTDTKGGPQTLREAKSSKPTEWNRLPLMGPTGAEMSRVLGGGVSRGSLILVGGDPGVGKSTLLLQVAGLLADGKGEGDAAPVLYVSGEESVPQICGRAERMGVESETLYLFSATKLEVILDSIMELNPRAVIIDSIQTVYLNDATGSAGSVIQVRECANALLQVAKRTGMAIFLVGHVTKAGDIAGPRVLEHIVDTVLYMEGERLQALRLLRGTKNRFGSTDEVGVFKMAQEGLVAVSDPSGFLLEDRDGNESPTPVAVAALLEGTRPILVEIQALCSPVPQNAGSGRRSAVGLDTERFNLLLAVLRKQADLKIYNQDIYLNVIGGLKLSEVASDLAVVMAVASSFLEKPIPRDIAFVGEVGLGGELRSVRLIESRIKGASSLGFKRIVTPKSAVVGLKLPEGMAEIIPCATVKEAILRTLDVTEKDLKVSKSA